MENKLAERLIADTLALGAHKAHIITTDAIETDRSFRDMCAVNACGVCGKCWMCPPDVGPIEELMAEIPRYTYALVYQTVTEIEDSYDFEGMIEVKKSSYPLSQKLRKVFDEAGITNVLHLGTGGCGLCAVCAKRTDEPCRYPKLAMPSLETYGINVSRLAPAVGMKYVNGVNTVTYFGAVLFSL